jgi:hypothetical protein
VERPTAAEVASSICFQSRSARAHDRIAELRDQVANWQPETLEGLIFKARYASDHFPEEYDDVIAHSIVDDLLAIAETGLRTVGDANV